eukprot:CAMPEP_0114602000 /NCGR_PEP_ID=MMETSP0125-20121206/24624_1 /TAXON_ID=485358 ORGANISM="Aristerostoma sp., Strain ATCC 50986" /NCGR_SAMPLE_ID=MMETSP0125 /ASSEMBLY_ACC=CAM_ASM_000245 /LENGTH=30 /DNA_ID= /DNA_START= /DNA_END= /DNA_ORIENTATION=
MEFWNDENVRLHALKKKLVEENGDMADTIE